MCIRDSCWIEASVDEDTLFVANTVPATISSFSFDGGEVELVEEVAAAGRAPEDPTDPFATSDGFIDMARSCDGRFLYECEGLNGTVNVYRIEDEGFGTSLTLVAELRGNLPETNTQGVAAI